MSDATDAVEAAAPTPTAPLSPSPPPADPAAGRPVESRERGELTTGTPTPHPDENGPPKHDAPKDEWLVHARSKGYDRADDDITLDELRRDYGA